MIIRSVIDSAPAPQLTNRQQQILHYISQGLTSHKICTLTQLALPTVKTHRAEILIRLFARNSAHAVAIAYRCGLLPVRTPDNREPPTIRADAYRVRAQGVDLSGRVVLMSDPLFVCHQGDSWFCVVRPDGYLLHNTRQYQAWTEDLRPVFHARPPANDDDFVAGHRFTKTDAEELAKALTLQQLRDIELIPHQPEAAP